MPPPLKNKFAGKMICLPDKICHRKALRRVSINTNLPGRGGGAEGPIFHFFMENHPTFQNDAKLTPPAFLRPLFSNASTKILLLEKLSPNKVFGPLTSPLPWYVSMCEKTKIIFKSAHFRNVSG